MRRCTRHKALFVRGLGWVALEEVHVVVSGDWVALEEVHVVDPRRLGKIDVIARFPQMTNSEYFGDAAAADGGGWIGHCDQPLKTIAGSTTMTLRRLAKLAITMITKTVQAVPAATSHGSSKPRRLIETREVISKKPAQSPMPIA